MSKGYTIMPRKSKNGIRYTAVCRIEGVYLGTKTLGRKSDVEHWAKGVVRDFIENRHAPHRAAARRTVEELFEKYKDEEIAGTDRCRPWSRRLEWWKEHFDLLKVRKLGQVQPAHISEGIRRLERGETLSGRKASGLTVRSYITTLSSAFSFGVAQNMLRENPVSGGKIKNIPSPKARKKEFKLIDADKEVPAFIDTCRQIERDLGDYVVTMLATGTRRSELLAVRWRDLKLDSGALIIQKGKGGKKRTVNVRGAALDVLRRRYDEKKANLDEVIFWTDIEEPKRRTRHCTYVFEKARRVSGIGTNIHGLRHAFASYSLMEGADLKTVSTLLGHSSVAFTADIYSHLLGSHLAEASEKAANRLVPSESRVPYAGGLTLATLREALAETRIQASLDQVVELHQRLTSSGSSQTA